MEKWTDFDESYAICTQFDQKFNNAIAENIEKRYVDLIEKVLIEKKLKPTQTK